MASELFFKKVEVWLIYNIMLVSGIQHSGSDFCRLHSILGYYKILGIILCAIQ